MVQTLVAELICVLFMIIGFALIYGSEAERKQFTIGLVVLTIGLVADLIIAGCPIMAILSVFAMIGAYFMARPVLW